MVKKESIDARCLSRNKAKDCPESPGIAMASSVRRMQEVMFMSNERTQRARYGSKVTSKGLILISNGMQKINYSVSG